MKTFVQLTLAVTLAATATASPSHHHGHHHLHAKKDASKVEKREPDVVTKIVAGPTLTVYKLDDGLVDAEEAEKGLAKGKYVIIGESTPTFTPPPAPSTSTTTTKDLGAQFIESKSTTTTTTPPPPPPTTTSTTAPPPSSTAQAPVANAAASSDNGSSNASGVDAEFPSGKIKCSEFPSQYGAVPADWLGFNKWLGLQKVPQFTVNKQISSITTGVIGDDCTPGTFCSYACEPGYQKSQWPKEQGSTGQSVGGLLCNSDGYLELTRPDFKTLCIPGQGGVSILNDLKQEVCTCRTDYPGTEGMYIPTCVQPNTTSPLTNPSQSTYYQWMGKGTSAQYYVNPAGVAAKDACIWTSPISPDDRGNWAAVIAGVGQAADNTTYISLFLNKPTSKAQPDFNMEILIENQSKCSYENGVWSSGSDGCTASLLEGQEAAIRYY